MKHIVLVLIGMAFFTTGNAAEPLTGYVVMANSDTVRCKIKGGRFLNNPFYGITIVNEQGEDQAFNVKERKITAFGFIEGLKRYDYLFIDVGDKLENGFYQRLVNGVRYKLYGRNTQVYGGNPTYVLYNSSGEFVKFEPCILCPWKKQLRELLKDDPAALALVENAPRVNIPQFVLDINKS